MNMMVSDWGPYECDAHYFDEPQKAEVDTSSPLYLLGEMLASAIERGGLHNALLWPAWLQGIDNWVLIEGNLLSVDMIVDGQNVRWFADPVTALLIARWRKLGHRLPSEVTPETCLAAFSKIEADDADRRGPELIYKATQSWSMRLPGLLSAYARGEVPGASVSHATWFRIIHGDVTPDALLEAPKAPKQSGSKINLARRMSAELKALKRLMPRHLSPKQKRQEGKARALAELDAIRRRRDDLQQALADWCVYALKEGKGRGGFAVSTTRSYLLLLIHLFDGWTYEADPESISPAKLETYVKTFLSKERNERQRNAILTAFRSFERFRAYCRDEPPTHFDLEEFRSEERASPGLLLPEEYARLVRLLDKAGQEELVLFVILLFRTGIRLEEAVGLRCADFLSGSERHELFVEKNEERDLKTPGSRRIIPLDILLEPDELDRLETHLKEQRQRCGPSRDGWLFGTADAALAPDPAIARQAIKFGLQRVAARPLRHNHLRHSFASYLLATLMLPADVAEPPVPRRLTSVISLRRRDRVAERLLGKERLGGSALHTVSQIMGHSGPDTTLRYYVHLLDWSLGLHCSRPSTFDELELKQICEMTGVGLHALRKARSRLRWPAATGALALPSRPSEGQLFASIPGIERKRADIHLLQSALRKSAKLLAVGFVERSVKQLPAQFAQPMGAKTEIVSPANRKSQPATYGRAWKLGDKGWHSPHAVPVRSMLGMFSGQASQQEERHVHWNRASAHLLPADFWQDKEGKLLLSLTADPTYLKAIEARLALGRKIGAREIRVLESAVRAVVRNRRSNKFLFRRLQEGVIFVNLLRKAMGFKQEEIGLRYTGALKRQPDDLHQFLKDRTAVPELMGRVKWRGSLAVGLQQEDARRILEDRAFKLMIILLAIHSLAMQMAGKDAL